MQTLIAPVSSSAKLHCNTRRHYLSVAIPDHWVSPFLLSTSAVFPDPWGKKTETDVLLSTSSFNSHLSCCTLHTAFLTSLYVFHPAWQSNTHISWQSKKGPVQDQSQVLNPYYSPFFPHLFHILQRLIKDEIKLLIVLPTSLSINWIRFQQNKALNEMFILHSWC